MCRKCRLSLVENHTICGKDVENLGKSVEYCKIDVANGSVLIGLWSESRSKLYDWNGIREGEGKDEAQAQAWAI